MFHLLKIGSCLLFLLVHWSLWAQTTPSDFNLTLVGHLPYSQGINDVWGYVDGTGIEYALVGTNTGVSIVSLSDPTQPTEVLFIPDVTTTHRDLKTWGDHAYVTAERGVGLLVIDLSPLPTGTPTYHLSNPTISVGGVSSPYHAAHNLFIDEQGYCYIAGSGQNSGGVIILDVHTDPDTPVYVGATLPVYTHDAYVRGDTLWSSDISVGYFSVYDVSDRTNPQQLVTQTTPYSLTHNAWLSDDGRTLFAVDEYPDAWLVAYDVSDLSNIRELDRYKTPTPNVSPHNTHTLNNYQVFSYYKDGLIILDNSRPSNLIEVARYDTYPGMTINDYEGAWGAYPYLPSGLILVTDMITGLHILQPHYQRGCWLEGFVTDQSNGASLFGVEVSIINNFVTETTDISGDYKTGLATAGTYRVRYSKTGYIPQTVSVTLNNGVLTTQNIQLVPAIPYTLTGQVVDQATQIGIPQAQVALKSPLYEYKTIADANGTFSMTIYPDDTFQIVAGQWGYLEEAFVLLALDSNVAQGNTYPLTVGYRDAFIFDYGWTETGTAIVGNWEWGIPYSPIVFGRPSIPVRNDVSNDWGKRCLLTGNNEQRLRKDPVKGGYTTVTSPEMDLSAYRVPLLHFQAYYNHYSPNLRTDSLAAYMTNGTDTVLIWSTKTADVAWAPRRTFRIPDYLAVTATMQVYFQVHNTTAAHQIEAAIDAFEITDSFSIHVTKPTPPRMVFHTYPNPSRQHFVLDYAWSRTPSADQPRLIVYNHLGQMVENYPLPQQVGRLQLGETWEPGRYIIHIDGQVQCVVKLE